MVDLVFFGTSEICLPFMETLHRDFRIKLAVSQPDTFGGRNRKKRIVPAVKTFALENGIPVEQPVNLKDPGFLEKIKALEPAIGIVIAYGQFIPAALYKIPPHRMINVHFSLLPAYRGAAPVQRAIQAGETQTGISIFQLVKKMDAGPVWSKKEFDIPPTATTASMWEHLSREGAGFLKQTVVDILEGNIQKTPQEHEKATFAPPVQKEEGKADWNLTAQELYNAFRAFNPWPGLFCVAQEKRFKLTDIRVSSLTHDRSPGETMGMDKVDLKVCCGKGTVLEIKALQPPGKKPMTPYCYCLGNQLPEKLG